MAAPAREFVVGVWEWKGLRTFAHFGSFGSFGFSFCWVLHFLVVLHYASAYQWKIVRTLWQDWELKLLTLQNWRKRSFGKVLGPLKESLAIDRSLRRWRVILISFIEFIHEDDLSSYSRRCTVTTKLGGLGSWNCLLGRSLGLQLVGISGVELAVELLQSQSFKFRPESCLGESRWGKFQQTVLSGAVYHDRFRLGKLHLFEEDPNDTRFGVNRVYHTRTLCVRWGCRIRVCRYNRRSSIWSKPCWIFIRIDFRDPTSFFTRSCTLFLSVCSVNSGVWFRVLFDWPWPWLLVYSRGEEFLNFITVSQ